MKGESMPSIQRWKLKDVLLVITIHFVAAIVAYLSYGHFISSEEMRRQWFLFAWSLLDIFLPVYWLKKCYNLNSDELQIKKGHWSFKKTAAIGVSTGVICFLFDSIMAGHSSVEVSRVIIANPFNFLLLPFSLRGCVLLVLTPIGEEIFFRGFIYGYFRDRVGPKSGLLIQALIFSLLHFDFISISFSYLWIQRSLFGLVLGVLCLVSGSIYPGVMCHSVTNYLINVAQLLT
jgi:membrane protease YdiL (CAAX protease family)